MDVIGLNLKINHAYVCEVTTHIRCLLYKDNRTTVERIEKKHERQKRYGAKYLKNFTCEYMFWSPVVPVGYVTEQLLLKANFSASAGSRGEPIEPYFWNHLTHVDADHEVLIPDRTCLPADAAAPTKLSQVLASLCGGVDSGGSGLRCRQTWRAETMAKMPQKTSIPAVKREYSLLSRSISASTKP